MTPLRRPWATAVAVWVAASVGAEALAGQGPLSWAAMQEEIGAREPSPGTTIAYGPGSNRFGELRLPPGPGPHPVAIVIHGGCWLSIADLSYVRPLAAELIREGWATWTLEFNRIDQEDGSWPGMFRDVAAGADHLRELAAEHSLDLGRVAAIGHSSGGHLALWLSARGRVAGLETFGGGPGGGPLMVAGVVGLAPVTGLEDFDARSDRCGAGIVSRLVDVASDTARGFEGSVDGPGRRRRLDVADPGRMLPLRLPQLMVFGADDEIVPPAHGHAWRRRAEALGDSVELRVVPGAGHFEVVAPWTPPWAEVGSAIRSFLARLESGA